MLKVLFINSLKHSGSAHIKTILLEKHQYIPQYIGIIILQKQRQPILNTTKTQISTFILFQKANNFNCKIQK